MSEDWGFCNLARECGFDIRIHADVIITHTGNHTFQAPPPAVPAAVNLEEQLEMKLEVVE